MGNLVKLAPRMRPAGAFGYPAAFVELLEAGIGVGLQYATIRF